VEGSFRILRALPRGIRKKGIGSTRPWGRFDECVHRYGDRIASPTMGGTFRTGDGREGQRLALHFIRIGLKTYDRMILQLPNEPEFVYCYLPPLKSA